MAGGDILSDVMGGSSPPEAACFIRGHMHEDSAMTANEQKFPVSKPALSVCADGSELPLELVAALQLLADAGGSVTIGSIHLAADEIRMVAQAAQGGTNFCLLRTRLTDPVAAITESGRAGGYKLVFNRCEGGEVIVRLQSKKNDWVNRAPFCARFIRNGNVQWKQTG